MSDPLNVSSEPTDRGWLLKLSGGLNAITGPELFNRVNALVPARDVRLDMSSVAIIDSPGFASVLKLWKHLASQDRWLTIVHPSAAVGRRLDLAGISQRLLEGHPAR